MDMVLLRRADWLVVNVVHGSASDDRPAVASVDQQMTGMLYDTICTVSSLA